MGLTELDSNKCKAVLRLKKQLPKYNEKAKAADEAMPAKRSVDKFGELTVKRLQQSFRIEFSNDEVTTIISAYKAGKSTYEIAKQFSCCKNTISNVLKQNGISVTNRKAQTRLPVDKVIGMYKDMNTLEKIAKHFGVSSSSIRNCLLENGVKLRSRWDYR